MHQAVVTIILGVLGTMLAQWLTAVHAEAQEANANGLTAWLTNFSNGDVLALIEILLICYIYGRVRDIQRAMPVSTEHKQLVPRIFGF